MVSDGWMGCQELGRPGGETNGMWLYKRVTGFDGGVTIQQRRSISLLPIINDGPLDLIISTNQVHPDSFPDTLIISS